MKLAALVPALFVLISMCGSPVPAPPGSVSGTVYFDANHNRIHDNCDKPLSATVSLIDVDGKMFSAIPSANGAFHIPDVPVGDAVLALTSAGDLFWPMTQHTADNRLGVAVTVKSREDTPGVDIASLSAIALPVSGDSVTGVVFQDTNANGRVDKDECGLTQTGVFRQNFGSVSGNSPTFGGFISQTGDGSFSMTAGDPAATIFTRLPTGNWKPTTAPSGSNPCVDGVSTVRAADADVYEALIGYEQSHQLSTISGTLFDDANSNGQRDPNEPGVPNASVFVQPKNQLCGATTSGAVITDENGKFELDSLVPDHYEPILGASKDPFTILITQGWSSPPDIDTKKNNHVAIDLPLRVQPSGFINLSVFNDVNQDGVRDTEDVAVTVQVCLYPNDNPPVYNPSSGAYAGDYAPTTCAMAYDGHAQFGPIALGSYRVVVGEKWWPQTITTDVDLSGHQAFANVGLPPVTSLSIPIFDGTPIQMDTCYSDPEWIQPSFDSKYDGTEFLYAQWAIDEAQARKIYGIGFYGSGLNAEVWTHLADLPWRLSPNCPGINGYGAPQPRYDNPIPAEVYEIAGFEPLSAVMSGNVRQVMVRAHGQGLYAIKLPQPIVYGGGPYTVPQIGGTNTVPYGQPALVFVDEAYQLIARCDAQGCERLDKHLD